MTWSDVDLMRFALDQARMAFAVDEVPVGAVVAVEGEVVAGAYNMPITTNDPTGHAEILALRQAAQILGNYRLTDVVLCVTLEPCAMCFGAIIHARVQRLIFGATDFKSGVVGGRIDWRDAMVFNHHPEIISGVLANECAELMRTFFEKKRLKKE